MLQILVRFAPYIVAIGLIIGTYFYGVYIGKLTERESNLSVEVIQQKELMNDMMVQFKDGVISLEGLAKKQSNNTKEANEVISELGKLIPQGSCVAPVEAIDEINKLKRQ